MGSIIGAIILGAISLACFIFSYMQFHEKGFLFNNAYIYASKEERETMNKKPHYKQSGIVFALIGVIFLINAVDVLKDLNVPILVDVDLGHLPPTMPLITGSLGVVNYKDNDLKIEMLLK